MEHVTVQGERVPALGLGTWRLTGGDCRRAVEDALAIGYRHIDTAQAYGNEAEIGAAIAASGVGHDELFVTTKLDTHRHRREAVGPSVEESLARLGMSQVDLLLIHHPADLAILEETLGAMAELREQGLVRHLGVSNFSVDLLERALAATPLFAVQIEYHPFREQAEQLAAARRHDLLFQAYSPLARGGVVRDRAVTAIARDAGASPTQVTLRWLLDQDHVAAIPKATSRAHLEENWGALEVHLDDGTRARIDRLTERDQEAAEVGV